MQEASINETGQKPHELETHPGLQNRFQKLPVLDSAGSPNASQTKPRSQKLPVRATSHLTDTAQTTSNAPKTDLRPSDIHHLVIRKKPTVYSTSEMSSPPGDAAAQRGQDSTRPRARLVLPAMRRGHSFTRGAENSTVSCEFRYLGSK